jgi:hypothetical protein
VVAGSVRSIGVRALEAQMALSREQLREAIERSQTAHYRIVDSDAEDSATSDDSDVDATDLPSVTLEAMRTKFEELFDGAVSHKLTKSSQFVLLEPDDEVLSDLAGPVRRVTVVSSESGDVVAEQG